MFLMILMAVIVPLIFGLLHTIAGVYLVYTKGNTTALGWNMLGFNQVCIYVVYDLYGNFSIRVGF